MKKMKTGIGVMLALLCCILMCTGVVYATGDDTDGTELQVAQPVFCFKSRSPSSLRYSLAPNGRVLNSSSKRMQAFIRARLPWGRTGFYEPSWAIAAATFFLA